MYSGSMTGKGMLITDPSKKISYTLEDTGIVFSARADLKDGVQIDLPPGENPTIGMLLSACGAFAAWHEREIRRTLSSFEGYDRIRYFQGYDKGRVDPSVLPKEQIGFKPAEGSPELQAAAAMTSEGGPATSVVEAPVQASSEAPLKLTSSDADMPPSEG